MTLPNASSAPAKPATLWGMVVVRMLAREHVLGLLLFICASPDRRDNAGVGLLTFGLALGWALWDGVLPRRRDGWPNTIVEGTLLYVGAVSVAKVLVLLFGSMAWG